MSDAKKVWEHQSGRYLFTTFNDYTEFEVNHLKQIHSNIVIEVNDKPVGLKTEADGLMIFFEKSHNSLPLAIKTADCLAVAFIGKKGFGIVHAGWRGLRQKILQHDLLKRIEPTEIIIGPHIKGRNYEVGPEFINYFDPSVSLSPKNEKFLFSQDAEAKFQIQQAYGDIPVTICPLCTFENSDIHSYRREKGSGRNVHVLRIVES